MVLYTSSATVDSKPTVQPPDTINLDAWTTRRIIGKHWNIIILVATHVAVTWLCVATDLDMAFFA